MSGSNTTRAHLVERVVAGLAMPSFAQDELTAAAPVPPDMPASWPVTPPLRPSRPMPDVAALIRPPIALTSLWAAGLVASPHGHGRSKVLEEIAMVQHQVLRQVDAALEKGVAAARIVLIASALPNEGKSFVALNLAASIAGSAGRPVVLVDTDGRGESLSLKLDAADAQGLRNLTAEPSRGIVPVTLATEQERLEFLPYGRPDAGVTEIPSGSAIAAVITRLAASMPGHVIVLDPPPCLSTSDCSALAAIAGQVVLVVDAERTARNEVEAALDVLEACPSLQLLLNRVRLKANDSFGAHGEYGAPNGG
jgi:receptor protein-tyrosine kinase